MACSTHSEKRNVYRVLLGKIEEKRQLGEYLGKTKGNIKMGP
jgi:hypothetical protein